MKFLLLFCSLFVCLVLTAQQGRMDLGKESKVDSVIATSGDYERYVIINGKQYTHIIDAKTGYPVQNMLSVSVIAPKGIDSDALSTSVFLKGAPLAEKICRENPKIQILIIRRDPQERTRILIERFGDIWDRDLKMESPELPAFEE